MLTVAAAWAFAAVSHAGGIPRTDDWAFSRVALTWARTGHLHLVGWGPMSLIGLLVWARPWLAVLGDHQWVLDLAASVLVAAGLAAAFRLTRLAAGRAAAVLAVATLAAAPGFVRDSATFMTDGPALAASTVALLAGLEAAEATGRRRWLLEVACVAAGCFAFSIRELAVAGPAAVLAVRWLAEPRRRRALGAGIVALGGFCLVFWAWRSGLPGNQAYEGTPPPFTVTELVVGVVFTTCLLLVPLLAATAPRWWRPVRPAARAVGMAVGGLVALIPVAYEPGSWTHRFQWLSGDYLDPRGINGDKLLVGSRPRLLPPLGWAAVEAVAVVAGLVVFGLVAEAVAGALGRPAGTRRRGAWEAASLTGRVLVAHLAILFVLLVIAISVNGATFDRYLWPAALSASILLLRRYPPTAPTEWHPAALQGAVAVATAFAVVSLLVTLNSDAFDAARWRAASAAVRSGVPAGLVDGGFEWAGYHSTKVVDAKARGDDRHPYWLGMVDAPLACVELTSSKRDDSDVTLVATHRWRTWLILGSSTLYEYRRPAACPG